MRMEMRMEMHQEAPDDNVPTHVDPDSEPTQPYTLADPGPMVTPASEKPTVRIKFTEAERDKLRQSWAENGDVEEERERLREALRTAKGDQ